MRSGMISPVYWINCPTKSRRSFVGVLVLTDDRPCRYARSVRPFRLTKERIRQIEKQALRHLRNHEYKQVMYNYLD